MKIILVDQFFYILYSLIAPIETSISEKVYKEHLEVLNTRANIQNKNIYDFLQFSIHGSRWTPEHR